MPYTVSGNTVHYQNADGTPGAVVPGGEHKTHAEALAHLRALEANVEDAKNMSEKTITTGNAGSAGFGVPDNAVSEPLQTVDTKFVKGDTVLVKSMNAEGVIASLAPMKSGAVMYRVSLKSGGFAVCMVNDLQWAGKAQVKEEQDSDLVKTVQPGKKTPNTPQTIDYIAKRITGMAVYVKKNLLDTPPNKFTLSIVLNDLNDLGILWQKLRTGAPAESTVADRLKAALMIFRQIHLDTPDKERRVLVSLLIHRLSEASRMAREVVLQRSRVASAKADEQPALWQKTKADLLTDAIREVQDCVKDGQPVDCAGVVVNDPESIRLANGAIQVKVAEGDWKALTDPETDSLCMRFECASPTMHQSMVKYAVSSGKDVPAAVLADYPEISQQQADIKAVKSATQLTKALIKALGLRYKRAKFDAILSKEVVKTMPEQGKKAARAIQNARRSGLLSGECEKALRRMKAQEGCRLIARVATLSMKQADLPAWLNTKYAPPPKAALSIQEMGK